MNCTIEVEMSRDKRRSFLTSFASEAIVFHKYRLSDLICLLSVVVNSESLDVNFCVILYFETIIVATALTDLLWRLMLSSKANTAFCNVLKSCFFLM